MSDAAALYALKVWQYKQGEVVSLMVHLGDRLGIYRAMDGAGPLTTEELATVTGLHERWLREWARGQAAAGLLETDAEATTFELSEEGAQVLAREDDSLLFAAGAFSGGAASREVVDALANAFRTGRGLTYDQLGPVAAHQTQRMLAPWARLALVPTILPALEGVVDKLTRGALVVDVGCGGGAALESLAAAYPASRFEGYDPSTLAIEEARQRVQLPNVTFHNAAGEDVPACDADLILTFDCLHDMTHPDRVAAVIRKAVGPGGTWLIREIRSSGDWRQDQHNPVLAMFYGFSVVSCMSSALSAPDGAGLGTVGLPPPAVESLCRRAGFDSVQLHDFDDPANLYYEVRAATSMP
ncbi:MAG: class I SAM-dependent methyltransferase [Acidimicrobiales bacterium]